MREVEYVDYLEEDFVLVIRLATEGNLVSDFAVVLYQGDELITKWDCAHGMVHRDVYGRKGALIGKESRVSFSLGEAFNHAVLDLKANYRRYTRERAAR